MTRLRLADVMAERLAEAHEAVDTPDEEQGTTSHYRYVGEPSVRLTSFKLIGCSSCQRINDCCRECQLAHWR